MKKIYYSESYRKTIVSTPEDETIFYPECGGQPGDSGFADDIRIINTKKAENGDSIYILEDGKTLQSGREYTFTLDWEHRYSFMKKHTCQHMLSGLLFTMFNIGTEAVHLGDEYITIEVSQDSVSSEVIEKLIERANQVIQEGHKVLYHEKSHKEAEEMGLRRSIKVDTDVRLVEIEGVDIIACGGVHVANTNEIQLVMFFKQEMIRGHVRLFFKCAEDAVKLSLENQKIIHTLVTELGCSSTELETKVHKVHTEFEENRKILEQLSTKNAVSDIENAVSDGIGSIITDQNLDAFVKASESFEDLAMLAFQVTPEADSSEAAIKWMVVLKGRFSHISFNTVRETLLSQINAKGGGKPPVYRGIASCSGKKLEELSANFKKLFC